MISEETRLAMNQTVSPPKWMTEEMEDWLVDSYDVGVNDLSVIETLFYLREGSAVTREQASEAAQYFGRLFNIR